MVLGAGASLASPASRPLFHAVRDALLAPLDLDLDERARQRFAPEALLSRLHVAGIDTDRELRRMLGGGSPNALHSTATEVLARGQAVWTTNFDELIEAAARRESIPVHRLLPEDDPLCECGHGHLVKIHGTLSGGKVLALSEQVMVPLSEAWFDRLSSDLRGAEVCVVGYAGADIDLRAGLRAALGESRSARWFGLPSDQAPLERRFAEPLATKALELDLSDRPDLAALAWATERGLTRRVSSRAWAQAETSAGFPQLDARYEPNDLLRARVLDDFGQGREARAFYGRGLKRGPRRLLAARALYSSGMIHGAPWRAPAVATLNAACRTSIRWRWPHRQRLPYLTWNVSAPERLPLLERSLALFEDDPSLLVCAASAAKEVDPRRSVELGLRALDEIGEPAVTAWATFALSLAFRWLGDIPNAKDQAARLADGYDTLAGPRWVAWGYFEMGAIAALENRLEDARDQMRLAVEVFDAIGEMFTFDAWSGLLAIERARGDEHGIRDALDHASALLDEGSLRRRFRREVLLVEEAELARAGGRLGEARSMYRDLAQSQTLAQELLGLLGIAEVQRQSGEPPKAAWVAKRRSTEVGFGYGEVHSSVTLGLAGEISVEEAERLIHSSVYVPPMRDAPGLLRYCQGPDPEQHLLCFP